MSARPKILLVLNDPKFAEALAKFLGTRGFEPVLVKNAASALESWKELKPDAVMVSSRRCSTCTSPSTRSSGRSKCPKIRVCANPAPVIARCR